MKHALKFFAGFFLVAAFIYIVMGFIALGSGVTKSNWDVSNTTICLVLGLTIFEIDRRLEKIEQKHEQPATFNWPRFRFSGSACWIQTLTSQGLGDGRSWKVSKRKRNSHGLGAAPSGSVRRSHRLVDCDRSDHAAVSNLLPFPITKAEPNHAGCISGSHFCFGNVRALGSDVSIQPTPSSTENRLTDGSQPSAFGTFVI